MIHPVVHITQDNVRPGTFLPENVHEMAKKATPYVEVDLKDSWDDILYSVLSGVFALFIDGFDRCILMHISRFQVYKIL